MPSATETAMPPTTGFRFSSAPGSIRATFRISGWPTDSSSDPSSRKTGTGETGSKNPVSKNCSELFEVEIPVFRFSGFPVAIPDKDEIIGALDF